MRSAAAAGTGNFRSGRRRPHILAALLVLLLTLPAPAVLASLPAGALQGQPALDRIAGRTEAVAELNGMTAEALTRILQQDQSAWLDAGDRLFYVDPGHEAAEADESVGEPAFAPPFDLADTFKLHSKPDSQRVIYLDFDGHVATNTAWSDGSGTINAEAYSLDGDKNSFNDTELERIQRIWRRVAEDFAPFDVNVTTEEPPIDDIHRSSPADQRYGTRAVITRDTFFGCGCGGVAYVGVFDYYSASNPGRYQPAWVFYNNLANGAEKSVAEATSHEVGHNLGLSHDGNNTTSYYRGHGSGATGWAPIMGVGYSRQLVQWSQGEYPNANQTQDDLAIIQANGALTRADDHGDTIGAATTLAHTPGAVGQNGIISTRQDVDVFRFFTDGGVINLQVDPALGSPNLDIRATLTDAGGTVLATANDPNGLSASIDATVSGGNHYLHIEGVGDTDPGPGYSDYASLGAYSISGQYPGMEDASPVAVAQATPTAGYVPLEVSFNGSHSADDLGIVAYDWDFGDGNQGVGIAPAHTYTAIGTYTVVLTVRDELGQTGSDSLQIEVTEEPDFPPVADARASRANPDNALLINFDAGRSSDDHAISRYSWDFGDGTTASGIRATHNYTQAGTYIATLTVVDDAGQEATDAVRIKAYVTTALLAQPAVARVKLSDQTVHQYRLSARLTDADTDRPIAGKPLVFRSNAGQQLCTVQTDADGHAICGALFKAFTVTAKSGYTVKFNGNKLYRSSQDGAGLASLPGFGP